MMTDDRTTPTRTPARIGYVIPEFPGQTHIWMWREIEALRSFGADLHLYSTRRPPERDRARHAFAEAAAAETSYLWPMWPWTAVGLLAWGLLRPRGLVRCVRLAMKLPITGSFRRLRLLTLLLPALKLARACEVRGLDHLHSHSCSNAAILCMMVKRLCGVPFSMTLNASIEWWGGAMREKFEDATFTAATTRWLLEQLRRDFPTVDPRRTVMCRVGVDTRLWMPGTRKAPVAGSMRMLVVARLHAQKGHDVLLEAVALLRRRGLAVHLEVIGDGPERARLEALGRRLGVDDCVTFEGSLGQEQIIERMRRADVFVLPSRFESLGVAYMEAMAMEVPTIGTSVGGIGEVIDHLESGVLVPPGDVQAVVGAVEDLARDAGMRERLGKAGRRKVVEDFDSRRSAAVLFERFYGRRPATGAE